MHDLRLVWPACSGWLAAGLLIAWPSGAGIVALALGALTLVAAAAAVIVARRHRVLASRTQPPRRAPSLTALAAIVCVCAASAALSATAVSVVGPARQPSVVVAGAAHTVTVEGSIDSTATRSTSNSAFGDDERVQFRMTISSVRTADRVTTGSMPALVFADTADLPTLRIGGHVRFTATMTADAPEDSRAFLVYANPDLERVSDPAPIVGWSDGLRDAFRRAAARLPGDGGQLLTGLAIGDVSSVSSDLNTDMKLSSLSHLTAVSGANCAVVIALMMLLGAALRLPRGVRVWLALGALVGFVVLVTPQPSVLRAAVMASIVVFSAASGRPGRAVPALALAVIALLVTDPWLSRDYGFALSVLATAGLLVLSRPLGAWMARWMPTAVATALSVPLAAQLACQPVLLLLNPTVPVYGAIANLLAEPAAPIATMLGLAACLILPIAPGLGFAVAQIAWVPSSWIGGVARTTVAVPGANLPWLGGLGGLALMIGVTITVVLVVHRPRARRGRIARVVVIGCVAVSIVCSAAAAVGDRVGVAHSMPRDWQIAACAIGQGDAVLLQSGTAHALVDVGPDPKPLRACLDTLGIDRIDLLVLTHYDLDHVGGLSAVVGHVDTALVGSFEDPRGERLVDDLKSGGADVTLAGRGDTGSLGALRWRVLWPIPQSKTMSNGNEGSVTMSFTGDGLRSIFLGDLDERAQAALLATGQIAPVDVVKVAHHGSADQDEELYGALHARVAVISSGLHNDYGHPTAALLGILARAGTQPLRTDEEGMVMVEPRTNGSLRTWVEHAASPADLSRPGDHGRGLSAGGSD